MNDFFLFLGIIAFFFILWVYGGGPHNPISFAGPFITPVTYVGDVQYGYGDEGDLLQSADDRTLDTSSSADSPYAGSITLGNGDVGTTMPSKEYIVIRSRARSDTNITGWKLQSTHSGTTVTFSRQAAGSEENANVLAPGDIMNVHSGYSTSGESYKESGGTWHIYLNQDQELWRASNETIELLDANGKVVDQYSY